MLHLIRTNAPVHFYTNSNHTPLINSKLNNFTLTGQVKNAFDTLSMPASSAVNFPKKIRREINNRDKKLKQGKLKMNDTIVYAKQYKDIRIKRDNDLMLTSLVKKDQPITHIPESKIEVKEEAQSKDNKKDQEILVPHEPLTPVTGQVKTKNVIEVTTISAKAQSDAEPAIVLLPDNVSADGALIPALISDDMTQNHDIPSVDDVNVYTYTIGAEPAGSGAWGLRWIWLPTILTSAIITIFHTARQFMSRQTRF